MTTEAIEKEATVDPAPVTVASVKLTPPRRADLFGSFAAPRRWWFAAVPKQLIDRLPSHGWAVDPSGKRWPFVRAAGKSDGVRVYHELAAPVKLELLNEHANHGAWSPHPMVGQRLAGLVPIFELGARTLTPAIRTVFTDDACARFELTYWDESTKLSIRLHADVAALDTTIEWTARIVYGDVRNDGQPQVLVMPELTMRVGGNADALVIDHREQNGIATPTAAPGGAWTLQVWPLGTRVHRGCRKMLRGAICVLADESRSHGRTFGLCMQWDGRWGPFGKVPQATTALEIRTASILPRGADRWRAQPPNSGQTGEQPDFGVASDLAVTLQQPEELEEGLWHAEAYALRPTCYVEPGGRTVDSAAHPFAELYNQRPDLDLGRADRMGWPGVNQIGWIPSPLTTLWTTIDNEHWTDLLLCAAARLTGEEWLYDIVEDHILIDRLDYHVKKGQSQASRALGRLSLGRAWKAWLGYTECLDRGVQYLRRALPTCPAWVREDGQHISTQIGVAKYGWFEPGSTNRLTQGATGWGDSIAATGFEALARVCPFGEDRTFLHEAALRLARYVTATYWREVQASYGPDLLHAYCVLDAGGAPVQDGQWPAVPEGTDPQRLDTHVTADSSLPARVHVVKDCDYWTASCAFLLQPTTARIAAVQTKFQPTSPERARWLALGPG